MHCKYANFPSLQYSVYTISSKNSFTRIPPFLYCSICYNRAEYLHHTEAAIMQSGAMNAWKSVSHAKNGGVFLDVSEATVFFSF